MHYLFYLPLILSIFILPLIKIEVYSSSLLIYCHLGLLVTSLIVYFSSRNYFKLLIKEMKRSKSDHEQTIDLFITLSIGVTYAFAFMILFFIIIEPNLSHFVNIFLLYLEFFLLKLYLERKRKHHPFIEPSKVMEL